MAISGLTPEEVRKALYDLEAMGIASNDTALHRLRSCGSGAWFAETLPGSCALEQGLIDLMREKAPDMERGETSALHLRQATQALKDEGHTHALPELLRGIVRSIAADGVVRVVAEEAWDCAVGTGRRCR